MPHKKCNWIKNLHTCKVTACCHCFFVCYSLDLFRSSRIAVLLEAKCLPSKTMIYCQRAITIFRKMLSQQETKAGTTASSSDRIPKEDTIANKIILDVVEHLKHQVLTSTLPFLRKKKKCNTS